MLAKLTNDVPEKDGGLVEVGYIRISFPKHTKKIFHKHIILNSEVIFKFYHLQTFHELQPISTKIRKILINSN